MAFFLPYQTVLCGPRGAAREKTLMVHSPQASWSPVVLMIDDAQADRDVAIPSLRTVFREVDVRTADRSDQGLQYLIESRPLNGHTGVCPYPDLVLVEINRPETRGLDFLREFRTQRIDDQLPIVVLSSCRRQHDITEAYRYGARACIQKPLEADHLRESLMLISRYFFARRRGVAPSV